MTLTNISPRDLGINLQQRKEEELFKWFLFCLLFGKPIHGKIAINAYQEFLKNNLTSPEKILDAGWDNLVEILDQAHYVRYDFSTATKLLEIFEELLINYEGKMSNILKTSRSKHDLRRQLEKLKGVGPVTASIFSKWVDSYKK